MAKAVTVSPNRVYVSKRGDNISFEIFGDNISFEMLGAPINMRPGDSIVTELTPQEALIMAATLQKYAVEQME